MQLPPNTLLQGGKYRIEKVLGQGGFGITYQAVQVALNRKVAVKEFFMKEYCERDGSTSHVSLGTSGSREMVERFRLKFIKEAQTIAVLHHPHIISIYDIFEENGTAYYVMEYIGNGSLADIVKKRVRLTETDALPYIHQVASALSYIHQRNMNHLDVKPGNILLDEEGNAVLIDFGLSKRYDEEGNQTSTTPVGISHGYAPIEQYKKGGVGTFSPATDIYSLGATLYKLLTGQTPPDATEVLDDGMPDMPDYITPTLQQAIERSMESQRRKRPQSISEFLSLLGKEGNAICKKPEDEGMDSISVEAVIEEPMFPINQEETVMSDSMNVEFGDAASFLRSKGVKELGAMKAVDLGLSVKWASCNIGSESAVEKGGLFGWGDALGGYTFETNYLNRKYIPNNIAGTEFDIVTRKMGRGWQMPTIEQWKELIDKCRWEWSDSPFCQGYIVTGITGEKIFIPAAGRRYGMDAASFSYGYYYVANRSKNNSNYVHYCFFSEYEMPSLYESEYYIGRSIRGIKVS